MTSLTKPIAAETLAAFRDLGADERDCAFLLAYDCNGNLALAAARARELGPRDPSEARLLALLDLLGPAAAVAIVRGSPLGSRLAGALLATVEAIDRHRGKGARQTVRVEHVHVHRGGQAVVGAVSQQGRGDGREIEHRPHAPRLAHEPGAPMRSPDPGRERVPAAQGEGPAEVSDARRGEG